MGKLPAKEARGQQMKVQKDKEKRSFFRKKILEWHEQINTRALPWKGQNDPYKIWLSEIILQQTRAEQGIPYYLKFTEQYPTIFKLAQAPDDEVFRLWQGLGYYARCRNMLFTARKIVTDFGGNFPNNYPEIRELKGVGNYTAAAIASFAFGLPHAVLDGNVFRVLSRYFGIDIPIDTSQGKEVFQRLADEVLDQKNPAAFNQSIMDLGAIVCTPRNPECSACPASSACSAKETELIKVLPVKSKKGKVQERYFNFLLLQFEDKFWLRRRDEKGIWKGLYEPYLLETEKEIDNEELLKTETFQNLKLKSKPVFESSNKQRLTHQIIQSKLFSINCTEKPVMPDAGLWTSFEDMKKLPFPKTILALFEKKSTFKEIAQLGNI